MSTTITAPQGFFQNDSVTPATISDLVSAVAAASGNISQAADSATAAAASATAANTSSVSAAASNTAAGNSATAAASSASAAAGSVTTAGTNATSAASSATAAATSATSASGSATSATASATSASTSATNASNSASAADTSATNAAASATTASNAVATIPGPTVGRELAMIRVNGTGTAYETRTPAQVLSDISAAAASDLSSTNASRNKLHNPLFTVQQRGTGPFTTNSAYTLDRWQIAFTNGTTSVTSATLADADRTAIGDEGASVALQNVFTGTSAAGDFNSIVQKTEGVRRLGNKTVTVSFWAKAASGTPKLGASLDQYFGSGGSPSAQVNGAGQAVTLSTTWTRYTLVFTLASLSGKTVGTNGDDATNLNFWYSSGSTNATRSGTVGVQSGTFQIWGAQLEVGSAATTLEKRDPRFDLALCQAFYRTGGMAIAGYNAASGLSAQQYEIPTMRAAPTVSATFSTQTNCSGSTLVANGSNNFQVSTTVTALGSFNASGNYTAQADL